METFPKPIPRASRSTWAEWDWERLSFQVVMVILAGLALLVLNVPTGIILIMSFSASSSLNFPPTGFSLQWYQALLDFSELHSALWNSLWIAMVTTLVCALLGIAAAIPLSRSRTAWVQSMDALIMSPLAVPGVSIGLAVLLFFNLTGLRTSILALVIAHIVTCIPYVTRTTLASLAQFETSLEQASTSLGANAFYTFLRVTLPLTRKGVIAGSLVVFLTSFDNLAISVFLADARTQVLPIRLWSMIENDLDIRAAAVSGVIVVVTAVLIVVVERVAGLSQSLVKRG